MELSHKTEKHPYPMQSGADAFLYKENHSLGEWFKKAYGDEKAKETPFAII